VIFTSSPTGVLHLRHFLAAGLGHPLVNLVNLVWRSAAGRIAADEAKSRQWSP
jgi:hypothetical protein